MDDKSVKSNVDSAMAFEDEFAVTIYNRRSSARLKENNFLNKLGKANVSIKDKINPTTGLRMGSTQPIIGLRDIGSAQSKVEHPRQGLDDISIKRTKYDMFEKLKNTKLTPLASNLRSMIKRVEATSSNKSAGKKK